jgi:hypothetical protein
MQLARGPAGTVVWTGVCFEEVLAFKGESAPERLSVQDCQLVANVSRLEKPWREVAWRDEELSAGRTLSTLRRLLKERALPAFEMMGSREGLLRKWHFQVLAPEALVKFHQELREQRTLAPMGAMEPKVEAMRAHPEYVGFGFHPSLAVAVTAAVIAARADRRDEAQAILRREYEAVASKKPRYAERLLEVADRLGVTLRRPS